MNMGSSAKEAEKEAVALRLAAKGSRGAGRGAFITPWEMELEMLEDWQQSRASKRTDRM
jgi:hypothetical protein